MRILTAVIYFISIEIILLIIAKVSVDRIEKRIKRVRYYRLQNEMRDKGGILGTFLGILAIYAPVFSILLETIGKSQKEPLINVVHLTLGITVVAATVGLCAYRYYVRVVLPKKKEELSTALRRLLSSKVVTKNS